jgi:hypothetical protein
MPREHTALIHWSDQQVKLGLPAISQTADPAWFGDEHDEEAWTLLCSFPVEPKESGNPTPARVAFLMDDAPHDKLVSGASLRLFERGTRQFALVSIVD